MIKQGDTKTLRAMRAKASPGRWLWNVNLASKQVYLECTGRGRGLEYVMSFERWGMSGAAPLFRSEHGTMVRADELTAVVPGREHHQRWYRTLAHPDAEWMVAIVNASDWLLDAAEERDALRAWMRVVCRRKEGEPDIGMDQEIARAMDGAHDPEGFQAHCEQRLAVANERCVAANRDTNALRERVAELEAQLQRLREVANAVVGAAHPSTLRMNRKRGEYVLQPEYVDYLSELVGALSDVLFPCAPEVPAIEESTFDSKAVPTSSTEGSAKP